MSKVAMMNQRISLLFSDFFSDHGNYDFFYVFPLITHQTQPRIDGTQTPSSICSVEGGNFKMICHEIEPTKTPSA